jgi:hypothetical protein
MRIMTEIKFNKQILKNLFTDEKAMMRIAAILKNKKIQGDSNAEITVGNRYGESEIEEITVKHLSGLKKLSRAISYKHYRRIYLSIPTDFAESCREYQVDNFCTIKIVSAVNKQRFFNKLCRYIKKHPECIIKTENHEVNK